MKTSLPLHRCFCNADDRGELSELLRADDPELRPTGNITVSVRIRQARLEVFTVIVNWLTISQSSEERQSSVSLMMKATVRKWLPVNVSWFV
jgi:hypothetical protein